MVSIMPVWKKSLNTFLTLAGLIVLLLPLRLQAAEMKVITLSSHSTNNIYLIDATLAIELGDDTVDALRSGIPLTFTTQVEMRDDDFLFDDVLIKTVQQTELAFYPLSNQFVLTNLSTHDQQSFATLDDALTQLGRIRNLPVSDISRIPHEEVVTGHFRMRLDLESLPTPLRLQALLSSDWRISTDWHDWEIDQ